VELGPTPTRGERGGNMFRKQHWYIVDQDGGEAREIWLGALIFSGSVDQLGGGERARWYSAASCRAFLCALCSVPASSCTRAGAWSNYLFVPEIESASPRHGGERKSWRR
jgi:hypothetical protein